MLRAGQTPHGARPNREEGFGFGRNTCRLGASQPPGRSLEPCSNARPRGMTVPPQGGQNSAYRSGCHNLPCFLPTCEFFRMTTWPMDFGLRFTSALWNGQRDVKRPLSSPPACPSVLSIGRCSEAGGLVLATSL